MKLHTHPLLVTILFVRMITLLEPPLFLISIPRNELGKYMQPVVNNLLYKDVFFSLTGNAIEWSLITSRETADVFLQLDPNCSVCVSPLQAYQVDIPVDSTNRIDQLSRVLSAAHISIFYLSTYQTDFLFVKQKHTKRVLDTLKDGGFEVDFLETHITNNDPLSNTYTDTLYTETVRPDSSTLSFDGLLKFKKEFSPDVPLTLVGLNRDSKEEWSLVLLRILFYSTPSPSYFQTLSLFSYRFISFTSTKEGFSLLTTNNILLPFKESHLFMSSIAK